MTRPRDGLYVWVTWLSKLMAGEVQCQWAPWFRTHYTDYERAPSDFQVATWTVEHTKLLNELRKERSSLGEGIYTEDQNKFRAKRPSGLIVAGKPDLVAIDKAGCCKVYDAKTGNPKHSDIIQVMLYMMLLPYASILYKGKSISGCVVYKNDTRSDIPTSTLNEDFEGQVTYFLNILEATESPEQKPSHQECNYCDITGEDCTNRLEAYTVDLTQDPDPEIPF